MGDAVVLEARSALANRSLRKVRASVSNEGRRYEEAGGMTIQKDAGADREEMSVRVDERWNRQGRVGADREWDTEDTPKLARDAPKAGFWRTSANPCGHNWRQYARQRGVDVGCSLERARLP